MFYALINRVPSELTGSIENFRRIYDKAFKFVPPHITIVFPAKKDEISEGDLIRHIKSVTENFQPFKVNIDHSELSFDQYLFLVPKNQQPIIDLHDQLYKGMLSQYLRTDIKFIPHIAVGQFTKQDYDLSNPVAVSLDEERYNEALQTLEDIDYKISYEFNNIELVTVSDDFKKTERKQKFILGEQNEV